MSGLRQAPFAKALEAKGYGPQACIRILVADGQEMFCECLASRLSLEPDVVVVGWCTGEAELLDQADLLGPDAVVLGLPLGPGASSAPVRVLRERVPGALLIVLPEAEEGHSLLELLEAGADTLVSRSGPVSELMAIVRAGMRGETRISPALSGKLAEGLGERAPERMLTALEREALGLAAEGLSNLQIAARLYASVSTTKRRLSSAFEKLGARTRHEAVARAKARGLIP